MADADGGNNNSDKASAATQRRDLLVAPVPPPPLPLAPTPATAAEAVRAAGPDHALALSAAGADEAAAPLRVMHGVLRDVADPESLIHSLSAAEARQLIADGTIASGMIPKIEGCLETLAQGVKKIHIIDGRLRHALLLEIYTTSGVGTELVRDATAHRSAGTSTAAVPAAVT